MANIEVKFSGGVVADPEEFTFPSTGNKKLSFPVYVNDQDKVDGEYQDNGDVTKIRVSLIGDLAGEDIRKGDIVEIVGTIKEREYDKKDGSKGRALETKYVNSIVVKWRKDGASSSSAAPAGGFAPPADGDPWGTTV